eukprot:162557-Amphidinium_carterae.1
MEREICFCLNGPKYAKPSGHKVTVPRTADPADVKKAIANMMHSAIFETDLIDLADFEQIAEHEGTRERALQ